MAKSQAPLIQEIDEVVLPLPSRYVLTNGIEVFDTRLGTEDVIKLEVIIHDARPFEHKKLVSRLTGQLLKDGAGNKSGKDIAEILDYYGATLGVSTNMDYTSITLYTLKKYFEELLALVELLMTAPLFPEKEYRQLIKRNKHKLALDISKNDVHAYRAITEKIFGAEHYYGFNSSNEVYDALQLEDIKSHFQTFYGSTHCQIFIAGKTDDHIISLLDKHLGSSLKPKEIQARPNVSIPKNPHPVKIGVDGSLQSAIRIGCHTFNRNHPDYCGMFVLNTALGGYFGSRLMTSIREDKGYTYNIYSMLDPMRFDGFFFIGTEVGTEFTDQAIKDIYTEMDKLCQEPLGAEEYLMMRRYLLGNMLTTLDGPFNVEDVIRNMLAEDAPLSHFNDLVDTVKHITPIELMELAQKYFRPENMWEVIVE
ncbi:MAG: insulinase family protein [Saprospiraceae bacterium]|nr:insulinase family protein [Saprospiraceae bacterium]